ncbi:MAG: DNA methyltransferase [Prevotella sp.]|nr:DNA methyltransferase [Prevotella sp.]MDY5034462.1 DNA methyltransferase [Prevotella sp.]
MTAKNPVRAKRNKTLTLTETELPFLDSQIVTPDSLPASFRDDIIVNGDVMECLSLIPDSHFDLVIADPPYNLQREFHGMQFRTMSSSGYEAYLRSWFYPLCDKLTPGGSLYMCGDWRCSSSMQRVIEERLTILNRITWQREKGRGARANWKNSMEDIWFAVKNPADYHFDIDAVKQRRRVLAPYRENGKPKDWEETPDGHFRLTCPSNFWDDISIPFWSMPENTDHPTQKPEKLYAKLILASSAEHQRILDPFLGSGTAAVVARKLGRHFCGIEINRDYCRWAAKRLVNASEDTSIQGYADGVFWERNTFGAQRHARDGRHD